jgi:hypothetical protein
MDENKDKLNYYVTWLQSEINTEHSYHNHKETMAWVVTALYVPEVVGLASVVRQFDGWWVNKIVK